MRNTWLEKQKHSSDSTESLPLQKQLPCFGATGNVTQLFEPLDNKTFAFGRYFYSRLIYRIDLCLERTLHTQMAHPDGGGGLLSLSHVLIMLLEIVLPDPPFVFTFFCLYRSPAANSCVTQVLLTAFAAASVSVGSCVLNDWFDIELDRVNEVSGNEERGMRGGG